jgi:hypothetical protein
MDAMYAIGPDTCDFHICMNMYMYLYKRICIYIYMNIILYVCIYMYICIYLYKFIRIETHMYICIYIYVYMYIHIYVFLYHMDAMYATFPVTGDFHIYYKVKYTFIFTYIKIDLY